MTIDPSSSCRSGASRTAETFDDRYAVADHHVDRHPSGSGGTYAAIRHVLAHLHVSQQEVRAGASGQHKVSIGASQTLNRPCAASINRVERNHEPRGSAPLGVAADIVRQATRSPAFPAWPGPVAVCIASCTTTDPGPRSVNRKGTVVRDVPEPDPSVRTSSQISLVGLAYSGFLDGATFVAAGSIRFW
jgi:hypothetical protein